MMKKLIEILNYCKVHRLQLVFMLACVVLLLIVHLIWIQPVMSEDQSLRDQTAREQELINKYQTKLEQAKGLELQLQKQEQELKQIQKRLVQGKDPYQLAAALGELAASKETEGLTIKSYQVLKTVEYGLYQEVRLKFNLSATIKGFYHFLASLQNSEEAISFQELNVQRRRLRKGPDLSVTVVIAALMEKPGTPKKS